MPAGKHADEQLLNYPLLPDDDLPKLAGDFAVRLVEPLDSLLIRGSSSLSPRPFSVAVHAGFFLQTVWESELSLSVTSARSPRRRASWQLAILLGFHRGASC